MDLHRWVFGVVDEYILLNLVVVLEFWKYQQKCMVYLPTVASSFMVHVCKCR